MPKYYFNLRTRNSLETDCDGAEFESIEAAIKEARRAACEIMCDGVWSSDASISDVFEITSPEGKVIAAVPFRTAADLG